jgi:putative FmdB family regulatory protein
MPTYEFRCPSGHEFEKFYRSISGAPMEVACPTCGKNAERLMSAGGGLVFKGSGFYITDYGKDGKKPQTSPVKAGDTATSSSGGGTDSSRAAGAESGGAKGDSRAGSDAKPSGDSKSGGESKSAAAAPPPTPSKSAAKGSSGRAKSSE